VPIGISVHRTLFNGTRGGGTPYLKTAVGVIPENNVLALKYIEKLGYRRVGVIPHACHLQYQKQDVSAIISYLNQELLEDAHGRTIT
jgi:hypothetical protein